MGIKNRNKIANVPNLRFREFEGEWEEKELGELCENIKERISTSFLSVDNYISTENILQNFQGVIPAISIPHNINVVAFRKNDVLFSNIRPYLKKIWCANGDGGCSADVFVFRGNDICLSQFLYHSIANDKFVNYVMSGTKGTKMPRGDKRQINQYPTYLPLKPEQEKITNLLSQIDDRISTQSQIIEGLQSLIKVLNNNLKELHGNEVEISLLQLGTSYSGLSGKSAEDFGSGKPFVTYMNVYKNMVVDESMVEYVNIDKNELQNKMQYGDVLFTVSSETPQEVGMSAVYLGNNNELYLNSFCFGYRLNNFDTLLPEYMPYLFSCKQFRKIVCPLAQGSTRFNLQKTDFLKMKFKLPTIQNQKKISNVLNALSEKLENEQKMLSIYQQQKKYLLNQMFI